MARPQQRPALLCLPVPVSVLRLLPGTPWSTGTGGVSAWLTTMAEGMWAGLLCSLSVGSRVDGGQAAKLSQLRTIPPTL